ncbi:hypothetical protein NHX12_009102 [Muraenolepis orangiensis]|uniref:Endonuclease/exonuclease/phosphatase domain-containing protein n=1 Tax=Muraenolepis orangiensis TaxID=630683 RepID=A0A9Q0DQ48_9TELE|nr:hypothetical protein NHX12_009102 [Muraenolepis orangiensis]
MATYNANTVREEARLEELANCVEERGVEILGVQEHRRVHTDQPILYHKVGGCSFITSSAWRNDAQAATGGVGLMVSPRARRALRRVQQHTDRILVADFEGNPVTTVMIREEARLEELANCVEERGVEILGVQEHRRVHTDQPILYYKVGGCSFITSSAWRNDAQAATGGVGLMVSPRARRALRRVQQHTDRILVADFEGNPVTTVMSVYSPTNAAPVEDVEKFYDELRTAIHHVPAHNFLVMLGDFNARLGPEDAPFTYHNNTNRNGEYLSALLTEHELLAANTLFRKRMGKRWTFQDRASGMLRQLDYILVRRKWRSSVLNAESYSTFDSVGSDHQVVSLSTSTSHPFWSLREWQEGEGRGRHGKQGNHHTHHPYDNTLQEERRRGREEERGGGEEERRRGGEEERRGGRERRGGEEERGEEERKKEGEEERKSGGRGEEKERKRGGEEERRRGERMEERGKGVEEER